MKISLRRLAGCAAILLTPIVGLSADQKTVSLDIAPPQAIARAIHLGAADPQQVLHLAVSLPYANSAAMEQFVASVSDPKSPNYRHFMTPEQVGQRFGLQQWQVDKVANFLRASGMNVTLESKNRLSILADTTISNASKTFGVAFEQFRSTDSSDVENPMRFSFMGSPKVPAEIAGLVADISGMENFTRPKGHALTPTMVRTLYSTSTIFNGGKTGAGRTIGISSWDGFRLSNASGFISNYGLPVPAAGALSNITVTKVDGGSGAGAESGEGDLDIQCALAVAPLANIIIYDGFNGDLVNVLTNEVNDNLADIITESYGWGISNSSGLTAVHNLHLSMSAQGITYLAASGDSGTTISTYGYPDLEPEVLIVGGTSVTTGASGTRTTETGWTGSGGGWQTSTLASFNVKPAYQSAVGPSGVNFRLVTDVAANADPNTGYTLYLAAGTYPSFTIATSGVYSGFGGTSAASPTVAASLALAEQQIIAGGGLTANSLGKQRFGRINDLLYGYNGNSSVLYDVTSGSNGTLPSGSASSATAGWDTVTGLGALNFQGLVNQVLGIKAVLVSGVTLSASTIEGGNGTTLTGTVTLSGAAPSGGQLVSLASSNAAVAVPASVTVAAGASSATFTVTTSAVSAQTAVTVTASTSTSNAVTASLTLTIPHPTALTLSSSSVSGGTSVTGTVTIAEKAPSAGVVVSLSSNNASVNVPATVTVASGATTATFTVTTSVVTASTSATVTATSGTGSATAGLTLTAITVKSLTLSSTSLYGGLTTAVTGTVTLSAAAPSAGVVVTVGASSTVLKLSATSITIASGKTTGTFTFTASAVSAATAVTLTATGLGTSASATCTVNPAALSAVSLSATSAVGGVTSPTFTATLTSPAGPSGTVVSLGSSNTSAAKFSGASITVAAGATSATTAVTTLAVSASTSVTLTGTSGVSKTVTLTVTPAALFSITLSASTVKGNSANSVTATVTLTGPAAAATTVTITSSNSTLVPVPASVSVAAGATSATFTIVPKAPTANTAVTITAKLGTVSKTVTLTVTP